MTKPIAPDEVGRIKIEKLPHEVFEAVNELIAAKYTNGRAEIEQQDIVDLILKKMNQGIDLTSEDAITKRTIFDRGWLNFEEAYRDYGWKVVYDKPAYYETYNACFKFSRA